MDHNLKLKIYVNSLEDLKEGINLSPELENPLPIYIPQTRKWDEKVK